MKPSGSPENKFHAGKLCSLALEVLSSSPAAFLPPALPPAEKAKPAWVTLVLVANPLCVTGIL